MSMAQRNDTAPTGPADGEAAEGYTFIDLDPDQQPAKPAEPPEDAAEAAAPPAADRPSPTPRPSPQREPDAETEPDAGADPAAPAASPPQRGRTALLALLAVIAVLGAVATAYLALQPAEQDTRPVAAANGDYTPGSLPSADSAAAVAAAVRAVPPALSYDHRSLDAGRDAAAAQMTPGFAGTFSKTFDQAVKPTATAQQAVTRAVVRGAGAVGPSRGGEVRALLFVDQMLVSSQTMKTPDKPAQISQNRVQVTMKQDGDRWLLDAMQPF
jgi:hypothetical protein